MIRNAGLGVAYKREIGSTGCCLARVNSMTLLDVMYLMGYSREEVKVLVGVRCRGFLYFFSGLEA